MYCSGGSSLSTTYIIHFAEITSEWITLLPDHSGHWRYQKLPMFTCGRMSDQSVELYLYDNSLVSVLDEDSLICTMILSTHRPDDENSCKASNTHMGTWSYKNCASITDKWHAPKNSWISIKCTNIVRKIFLCRTTQHNTTQFIEIEPQSRRLYYNIHWRKSHKNVV